MSRTRKQKKFWDDEPDYQDDDYHSKKNKNYDRRKEKKMKNALKTKNFEYFREDQE